MNIKEINQIGNEKAVVSGLYNSSMTTYSSSKLSYADKV